MHKGKNKNRKKAARARRESEIQQGKRNVKVEELLANNMCRPTYILEMEGGQ
jgi:hypothetical protein